MQALQAWGTRCLCPQTPVARALALAPSCGLWGSLRGSLVFVLPGEMLWASPPVRPGGQQSAALHGRDWIQLPNSAC